MSKIKGVYMLMYYGYSKSIFFIPEDDFDNAFEIKTDEKYGTKYVDMKPLENISLDYISKRSDSYLCNHELNHTKSHYSIGHNYNMNIKGIYEIRRYYAN